MDRRSVSGQLFKSNFAHPYLLTDDQQQQQLEVCESIFWQLFCRIYLFFTHCITKSLNFIFTLKILAIGVFFFPGYNSVNVFHLFQMKNGQDFNSTSFISNFITGAAWRDRSVDDKSLFWYSTKLKKKYEYKSDLVDINLSNFSAYYCDVFNALFRLN